MTEVEVEAFAAGLWAGCWGDVGWAGCWGDVGAGTCDLGTATGAGAGLLGAEAEGGAP